MLPPRPWRPVLLVVLAAGLAACSGLKPPTEPAGGLQAWGAALMSDDPAMSWGTLSPEIQTLYTEALTILLDTGRLVEGVQPAERPVFRERGGLDVLGADATPRDLYAHLLQSSNIPRAEAFEHGLRASSVIVDGDTATIETRGGTQFTVVRGGDGIWRVHEPLYTRTLQQLEPIARNRTNLRDTVALFGGARDIRGELTRLGLLAPEEPDDGPGTTGP